MGYALVGSGDRHGREFERASGAAEAAAKRAADDAACAVSEREEERAADLARVPALENLDRAKRRLTACRDSIDSMLAAKETAEAAAREAREEAARASSAADKKRTPRWRRRTGASRADSWRACLCLFQLRTELSASTCC